MKVGTNIDEPEENSTLALSAGNKSIKSSDRTFY
jgi:hypothetical protein